MSRAQEVLESAALPSRGVYAATGDYSHEELFQLAARYMEKAKLGEDDVMYGLAQGVIAYFHEKHPHIFTGYADFSTFLRAINSFIHPEVYRIHPGAELPVFNTLHEASGRSILLYQSPRRMPGFAKAMIMASAREYDIIPVVDYRALEGDDDAFVFDITWEEKT